MPALKAPIAFALVLILIGCAPVNTTPKAPAPPELNLTNLTAVKTNELVLPFLEPLKQKGVTLNLATAKGYQYDGTDERAFLVITDRFYLENPGFCPLESGQGFLVGPTGKTFLTLAANNTGLEVRGYIYDLKNRPKVEFIYIRGFSMKELKIVPC
jgi:hypothetical protein